MITSLSSETARIWAVDGTPGVTLGGDERVMNLLAIAPDGCWLATASRQLVRIGDATDIGRPK